MEEGNATGGVSAVAGSVEDCWRWNDTETLRHHWCSMASPTMLHIWIEAVGLEDRRNE